MKNKNVGYLIVGLSLIIGLIILIFNLGMKSVVSQTCVHGPTCTMYDTISIQTYFSLAIAGIIFLIGIFFIFSKETEKIIIKKVKQPKKKIDTSSLSSEEKRAVDILLSENGALFQKTLMEKLNIGKVGMTRLIDKLEAKQIVERKRRGMNNIVVLKK